MDATLIALTTGIPTSVVLRIIDDLCERGRITLDQHGHLDERGWELTRLIALVTAERAPVPAPHAVG